MNKFNNHLLWHFAAASALLVVALGVPTKGPGWAELAVLPGQAAGGVINPQVVQSADPQTGSSGCDTTQNFNFTGCRQ